MDHTTNKEERHESSDYEREERPESDYGRVGVSNDGMHRSQEAEDNCTSNLEPDAMVNINNESDDMGDAAALFVWMYLLLISALLICAVIIGSFVVVNYGFVVLIAVITAASALTFVAATLMSAITGDAKLTKARSTVDAWHVVVKDTILEEIDNLKEDISAFGNGTLLLTYEGPEESFIFEQDEDKINGSDVNNQHKKNIAAERKPKSLLFKYVVSPFTKIGSKKESKSSRKLFRKKKQHKTKEMSDENGSRSSYLPPVL